MLRGWVHSSVVECLPNKHKALCSLPSTRPGLKWEGFLIVKVNQRGYNRKGPHRDSLHKAPPKTLDPLRQQFLTCGSRDPEQVLVYCPGLTGSAAAHILLGMPCLARVLLSPSVLYAHHL